MAWKRGVHNNQDGVIRKGLVRSAHDCSEGGLAVALAESCFGENLGACIDFAETDQRTDVVLFNESQGRIVISVSPSDALLVESELSQGNVPFLALGVVTEIPELRITVGASDFNWPVANLNKVFEESIPSLMEG